MIIHIIQIIQSKKHVTSRNTDPRRSVVPFVCVMVHPSASDQKKENELVTNFLHFADKIRRESILVSLSIDQKMEFACSFQKG